MYEFLKEYVNDMNTSNGYRLTTKQKSFIINNLENDEELWDFLDMKFYDYYEQIKQGGVLYE